MLDADILLKINIFTNIITNILIGILIFIELTSQKQRYNEAIDAANRVQEVKVTLERSSEVSLDKMDALAQETTLKELKPVASQP